MDKQGIEISTWKLSVPDQGDFSISSLSPPIISCGVIPSKKQAVKANKNLPWEANKTKFLSWQFCGDKGCPQAMLDQYPLKKISKINVVFMVPQIEWIWWLSLDPF